MNREVLKRYKDEIVSIGVPHFYKQGCVFFHNGILKELGNEELCLKKKTGDEVFIPYDRILEFSASGSSKLNE